MQPVCTSPGIDLDRLAEPCLRLLVPVKRLSDLDAVLAYVRNAAGRTLVRLFLLHVTPPARPDNLLDLAARDAMAAGERSACSLLAQAAKHCEAHALQQSSYILSGDVAFSILDAAELLGCDEIVMARRTDWLRRFFSSQTVRKMGRLNRHVPLVLVDSDGIAFEEARA